MLNAIRAGGVLLIMAVAAVWYAYDQAGASRARDDADVASAYHGGGGGGGGGGGRGRHRLSGPVDVVTASWKSAFEKDPLSRALEPLKRSTLSL